MNYFWYSEKRGIAIDALDLKDFLIHHGFGQFQNGRDKRSSKEIFQNVDGVLTLHNAETVKKWLHDFVENAEDKEFKAKGKLFNPDAQTSKKELLRKLQTYSESSLSNHVLYALPVFTEQGFVGTTKLELFNDAHDVAHFRFLNGIVRVTAKEIKLLTYKSIKTQGAVWDSSIIQRDIQIDNNKGLFEKFAENAMKRGDIDKVSSLKDWTSEFNLNEDFYKSMRTSYGYMLHTHNSDDVSRCIYYIDFASTMGKPEGGNGKSVVMQSVKHFKSMVSVDGKAFRQNMEGGGRFQFATVTMDTKFVLIDDIRPEFNFDMLFSKITGDMEIERKGRDIIIISKERKPKFGVTTNYVIAGTGTSYTRRQHITEFGNYWNYANRLKESPSSKKHLGKSLFSHEFLDKDWNQFYSYGFRCAQEYFQFGLHESQDKSYLKKAIGLEIEGAEGDGVVTAWLDTYCSTAVGKYKSGQSDEDIYKKFKSECKEYCEIWDKNELINGLWKYCEASSNPYQYNAHKKGSTKSERRDLKGPKGKQKAHVTITENRK
jgi:hypothetical protein